MAKLKKRKRQNRVPEWIKERIAQLDHELATCTDGGMRRAISKKRSELRRMVAFPSGHKSTPKVLRDKSSIATAASGWVQIVQGGAPGSGRGGRSK